MTRVVFLGTPDAAVPTLRAVAGTNDVALVVTQPDRPKGRSRMPQPSPVKVAAEGLGLPVAQPRTNNDLMEALAGVDGLELGVVVAFGRILRPEVLGLANAGYLNVHFSLLPRWRGAAPVERALESGDTMTGVTIIRIDEGLDTGPVLTAQAVDIAPSDNAGTLTDTLSLLGARLMVESIPRYVTGELEPVPQTNDGATYAAKIEPADRPLDPQGTTDDFVRKVRALAPTPGATLTIDNEVHKILDVEPAMDTPAAGTWASMDGVPVVGLADRGVVLRELQPPGKKPMSGAAWVRGRRVPSGRVQ